MNVVLPPPEDFDYIARATGDDSWRGENLIQYYEEFERNTYTPPGTDGHGYDGYIAVRASVMDFDPRIQTNFITDQQEQHFLPC